MGVLTRWWRRDDGQDVAEYCLAIAVVALFAAALLTSLSGGVQNLWQIADRTTNAAAVAAGR